AYEVVPDLVHPDSLLPRPEVWALLVRTSPSKDLHQVRRLRSGSLPGAAGPGGTSFLPVVSPGPDGRPPPLVPGGEPVWLGGGPLPARFREEARGTEQAGDHHVAKLV